MTTNWKWEDELLYHYPRGFDAFYAFARVPKRGTKRGPPKGSIDAIEARLHQTGALVGILLGAAGRRGGRVEGFGTPSPAPSSPVSIAARAHGNNGSAHNTSPPIHVSAHPSTKGPGAFNAGQQGWISGVQGASSSLLRFLPSFSLRAPWPSFRPSSLLSYCCAEVACRDGADGAAARRKGRVGAVRWRDSGIAVVCSHCDPRKARTLPPRTSSWHRRIRSLHGLLCPPHVGRPRFRAACAAYALSLPGFAVHMRTRGASFPASCASLLLSFLFLLHPRDAFPFAFAFGLFAYFLHLHCIRTHMESTRGNLRLEAKAEAEAEAETEAGSWGLGWRRRGAGAVSEEE
ncbi:hypothetical protein DFH09DRAFT_1414319 [Mycena vulgaris]|nr:hypothetical protein DFH09DRAFT_1414319 [Mycena vulgaris]